MRRGRQLVIGAACLMGFVLSGCDGGDEAIPNVPPSPARTLVTPSETPAHPKSPKKPVHSVVKGAKGGPSKALLDEYVAQSQKQLETQLGDAFKDLYSDISLRPKYPSGVEIVYVFKQQVSPATATASLNQSAPVLKKTFSTLMAPEMKSLGFAHPSATWTYRNPDGSLVWTVTFP